MNERLEQAYRDRDLLQAEIDRLEKEAETIWVPDDIVFQKVGDGLGLWFGKCLCLGYGSEDWGVIARDPSLKRKCQLVKCDKSELKEGDWFYCTDWDDTRCIENKESYKLWLGDGKYLYVSGRYGVEYPLPSNTIWTHYYKVVNSGWK